MKEGQRVRICLIGSSTVEELYDEAHELRLLHEGTHGFIVCMYYRPPFDLKDSWRKLFIPYTSIILLEFL